MREKLAQALEYISEKHITEAAEAKKVRKRRPFLTAMAAVLAVAILMNLPYIPMTVSAKTISAASEYREDIRPDRDNYETFEEFRADLDIYDAAQQAESKLVADTLATLTPFFTESGAAYMAGSDENRVWSPINAYIALATLAEITDGNSRRQILDTLGISDLELLRTQVSAIWEDVYRVKGQEMSLLANSLWLDNGLDYDQDTMDTLAYHYYTSVYQTDLGTNKANRALNAWLQNNTGGLLKTNASFPEEAVLTLASTVYLQSKWSDQFSALNNTIDIFHAPSGDRNVTYMNKKELKSYYYWGDSFGAVSLGLKNNCRMWFFLPDADKTVNDVLAEGQYLELLVPAQEEQENRKYMKVNLTVPKFDVSSSGNLKEVFMGLGITDVFNENSNFTAITDDSPVCLTAVNQSARVIIDEEGVKAASYIELPGAGAAEPPEEIIDFILDRPFVFVIADSSGIPLFTGVVNEP